MRQTIIVIAICLFIFNSCKNKSDKIANTENIEAIGNVAINSPLQEKEGLKLLEKNCFSCHSPSAASHDNMLAPPLAGIKFKYKQLYPSENEFVTNMSNFVNNPNEENAVMKGPVKRFGLMPKTSLTKPEIQKIVTFIYKNKLPAPNWYAKHSEEQHNRKGED